MAVAWNQEPGLNFKRYQMMGTIPPQPQKNKPKLIKCEWCWHYVKKDKPHDKCFQQQRMCGY